jgi:hypothetical protein
MSAECDLLTGLLLHSPEQKQNNYFWLSKASSYTSSIMGFRQLRYYGSMPWLPWNIRFCDQYVYQLSTCMGVLCTYSVWSMMSFFSRCHRASWPGLCTSSDAINMVYRNGCCCWCRSSWFRVAVLYRLAHDLAQLFDQGSLLIYYLSKLVYWPVSK